MSAGEQDETVGIWLRPDVNETSLHLRLYDQLLAKLRAPTNRKAVPDEPSATGHRTELGEFPGWREVPTF